MNTNSGYWSIWASPWSNLPFAGQNQAILSADKNWAIFAWHTTDFCRVILSADKISRFCRSSDFPLLLLLVLQLWSSWHSLLICSTLHVLCGWPGFSPNFSVKISQAAISWFHPKPQMSRSILNKYLDLVHLRLMNQTKKSRANHCNEDLINTLSLNNKKYSWIIDNYKRITTKILSLP